MTAAGHPDALGPGNAGRGGAKLSGLHQAPANAGQLLRD